MADFLRWCTVLLACLAAACAAPSCSKRASRSLTIAAASSMKPALDELMQKYMQDHAGSSVIATYGSSGNHYAQLTSKAPFDLFYSADMGYPRKLVEGGLAPADSLRIYATGALVLWSATTSGIDPTRGTTALIDSRVKHIAIANPQHAPYGRAAKEAMAAMGLEPALASKLVLGENVEQTAQFAQSGAAELAFLPLSLAGAEALRSKGAHWVVPAEMYKPIEHGVVVLSHSTHIEAAKGFDAFVAGPAGREILRRHGFTSPGGP